MSMRTFLAAALLSAAALLPVSGQAMEKQLVVVTSFPKDLTSVFKQAFEKKYPGIKVDMLKKKTTAGVKYIQETAAHNTSDIFWASAPDAFEVLKGDGLLAKYQVKAKGIPDKIGAFPLNDPDGYYKGFAASGYGIMWNTRYLKAKKLPAPKEWEDLARAIYHDHVGMSAPSRSGTTHLTVETVLQGKGWKEGWALWKAIGGNLKTVTERSFGVPAGVNSGEFGLGIVIDFFGFSSKATGYPVEFAYPSTTALVPANIAIVKNAPHPQAAAAFIEFLLSPEGQELLLDPKIQRLPVRPELYETKAKHLPNPFKGEIAAKVAFDVKKSKARYNVVNSLFDVMITYRLNDLKAATKAIHEAAAALKAKPNAEARKLLDEARALVAAVPIDEAKSLEPAFASIFKKKRKKATDKITGRQAEVEQQWDAMVKANYEKARALAEKARSMAQ